MNRLKYLKKRSGCGISFAARLGTERSSKGLQYYFYETLPAWKKNFIANRKIMRRVQFFITHTFAAKMTKWFDANSNLRSDVFYLVWTFELMGSWIHPGFTFTLISFLDLFLLIAFTSLPKVKNEAGRQQSKLPQNVCVCVCVQKIYAHFHCYILIVYMTLRLMTYSLFSCNKNIRINIENVIQKKASYESVIVIFTRKKLISRLCCVLSNWK